MDGYEGECINQLKRLRQAIAEQWPQSTNKDLVLRVLDEMVSEAVQAGT
jgi:hypothetical protein